MLQKLILFPDKYLTLLIVILSIFMMTTFFYPLMSFAHGEAIEVNASGSHGPLQLSSEQQKAIGLTTALAKTRSLAVILSLNGTVQLLPNNQADITARISGQVTEIYVNLTDNVKRGQPLTKIQSRLVGSPPPSVMITAPINGVIDARNINLGQAIEPNTILFHISERSKMLIIANVYEEDIGKVKAGQEATIHLLSYPDKVFQGKVQLIEPNLDPLTRTSKVWIIVDNPEGMLKPDMFAKANLILQKKEAILTIPNNAILEANSEQFVFVRDGNRFQRIEIEIGASDDNNTEIIDGLVPGDEVVVQGNRQIYTMWLMGGKRKAQE